MPTPLLRRLRPFIARRAWFVFLLLSNFVGRKTVTGDSDCVVSLTSYGARIEQCYVAIESIARGKIRPVQLILWLDDPEAFECLPASLRRLRWRGLTIRLADNLGPHTKYFPYVESEPELSRPLVTADDDIMYPRAWLHGLLKEHSSWPDQVVCYRARQISLQDDGFASYASWPFLHHSCASLANFGMGVSGALYPVDFQRVVKKFGRDFQSVCPRADDIWLHALAVEADIPVRVVGGRSQQFPNLPGSQATSLKQMNVLGGENDAQIRATYTPTQISKIRAAVEAAP